MVTDSDTKKDLAIQLAKKELPSELFEQHVPLSVFEDISSGLATLPLAPEYEIHCETCETCAANYQFVTERLKKSFSEFSRSIIKEEGWKEVPIAKGVYRGKLLSALEIPQKIYAVAGELNCAVYDHAICSAVEDFCKTGGEFNIIAGPVVEILKGTDKSPFLDLIKRNVKGVNYFVSDRRQSLHFAIADKTGLIHLEAYHDPMATERMQADESYVDWAVVTYLMNRYRAAFYSPDVRPYRKDTDVVFDYKDNIKSISASIATNGLRKYGKYGYLAEREIEKKAIE